MTMTKPKVVEFQIGTYICPHNNSVVPLKTDRPLAFLEWPVVVQPCPSCGHQHVLQCTDVQHPPVFGYE